MSVPCMAPSMVWAQGERPAMVVLATPSAPTSARPTSRSPIQNWTPLWFTGPSAVVTVAETSTSSPGSTLSWAKDTMVSVATVTCRTCTITLADSTAGVPSSPSYTQWR